MHEQGSGSLDLQNYLPKEIDLRGHGVLEAPAEDHRRAE